MVLTLLVLVLGVLAAARLRRLIGQDTITDAPRLWVLNHLPMRAAVWLAGLLDCVWCLGMWTSAGVSAALVFGADITLGAPWWIVWPLLTLAYSQAIGWAATVGDIAPEFSDPVEDVD